MKRMPFVCKRPPPPFIGKGILLVLFILAGRPVLQAQAPDSIYTSNIKTVLLYTKGSQLSMPVVNLNATDRLELQFDDLDADVKYYYYTYQLCNSDWSPVALGQFDYLKGFMQNRITSYQFSSLALTRYTHYSLSLPESSLLPTRPGNYLLKVFLNGDTSRLAFTKRFFVLDSKASVNARVTRPLSANYFQTHQKLQFTIDTKLLPGINASQEIKVVILQNFRWDNAMYQVKPAFVRGPVLEYNSENSAVFPAGKEWRWLDLRDFRLQTDRVSNADYGKTYTRIFLKTDAPLAGQRYVYYKDLNGMASIEAVRGINPFTQGDYATVYFSFQPPDGQAYTNSDVYLFGQLTNYSFTDSLKMRYDPSKGIYETHLFMKQGYYDYTYVVTGHNNPAMQQDTDGNYFETENIYTILVYYKPFIGRYDQLIGVLNINSRADQPGISF